MISLSILLSHPLCIPGTCNVYRQQPIFGIFVQKPAAPRPFSKTGGEERKGFVMLNGSSQDQIDLLQSVQELAVTLTGFAKT